MNDEQIYNRGGDDEDVRRYAEENGANLTKADVAPQPQDWEEEFDAFFHVRRFPDGSASWVAPDVFTMHNFIRQLLSSEKEKARQEGAKAERERVVEMVRRLKKYSPHIGIGHLYEADMQIAYNASLVDLLTNLQSLTNKPKE